MANKPALNDWCMNTALPVAIVVATQTALSSMRLDALRMRPLV
jgi:hypothetical protein